MATYNLYSNHMGGYYSVESDLDESHDVEEYDPETMGECEDCGGTDPDCYNCGYYDPLYCDQCGDSDYFIGEFSYNGDLPEDSNKLQNLLCIEAKNFGED